MEADEPSASLNDQNKVDEQTKGGANELEELEDSGAESNCPYESIADDRRSEDKEKIHPMGI